MIAIRNHDQYWTNRLFELNANVLNETESVLNLYLQEPFYEYQTLIKIKGINLQIGYPIQIALKRNDVKKAEYLCGIT